jgi:glycosyltransferase involved in cell wall biosynthesis
MRIGIDARMYGSRFTGIGIYTEKLVEYLSENDSENDYVLFLSKEGMSACTVSKPNFKKTLADARHYSWKEQLIFPFVLLKERLDLMHFTHFNAPFAYRGRSVVTIHDLTLSFYPGRKMTGSLHRLAYQTTIRSISGRAKRIFAVSAHTKKDLIEILDIPEEKIIIVKNGVERGRFEAEVGKETVDRLKERLRIEGDYLLYTGVFREHKNLVRLVEAFGKIAAEFPAVDLVLVGKEDPGYRDVRDAIVRLGLSGRVKLPGFMDSSDLVTLYKGAIGYAFPSLYEGFGLPILEAMAAGIPVLCSKGSSLTEVAGDANAAFFNPLDTENMASVMAEFLRNGELRKQLSERGLVRVREFSWEKTGAAILSEYRKVLEEIPRTGKKAASFKKEDQ